jgi:hypothetical protein
MNIAEILRKCPKWTKLYSPVYGEVELIKVDYNEEYPITCITKNGFYAFFTRVGMLFCDYSDTECMLFPSKDQRDWSKFGATDKETKPQFKPFDKVLVRDRDDRKWGCDFFCHLGDKEGVFVCISSWWRQCIPYEGNEHLLGTTNKQQ